MKIYFDFYVDDQAVLFENNWPDIVELIHRSMEDAKGLEREKLNEVFAEELEEADQWGAEDREKRIAK